MNFSKITDWFTKGKVIFVTIAGVITFAITMYNQFKSAKTTEISGFVSSSKDGVVPVDAIVKISSPIQGQTETDSKGHFKFKFSNIQSDTFLIIVQNKRTNLVAKQNEYVDAGEGRKDILVLLNSEYGSRGIGDTVTNTSYRRRPDFNSVLNQIFHSAKKRH